MKISVTPHREFLYTHISQKLIDMNLSPDELGHAFGIPVTEQEDLDNIIKDYKTKLERRRKIS